MRRYVFGIAVMMGLGFAPQVLEASSRSASTPLATPVATLATTSLATPLPTLSPTAVPAKSAPAALSKTAALTAASGDTANASVPHRYPGVATLLAFIPGVVIHGAGHMYAHSWMKGVGLFLLEGASTYLLWDGYHEYTRGAFNNIFNNNNNNNNSGGGIPSNLGGAYEEVGVAVGVAVPVWFYTWFDDISGAGIAARQFDDMQQQNTVSLHLEPRPDGAVLALSSNF
jgi:hypothetical protein